MQASVQPVEVIKGSVNLLRLLVNKKGGTYRSYEQHAIENVLTELNRLQAMEAKLIAKGIEV